jgi:UDP-N-acetylmuramate--alanine ligase
VHLLGVAGAGMRGLAEALSAGGWRVSGSDRTPGLARADLEALGVRVVPESDVGAVREAVLVIASAALAPDHPSLVAAAQAEVPVIKRARALGALVNDRRLAAVAGTHGKTTTTTMLALALEAAGRDPLAFTGGRVPEWDGNARIGRGDVAVVEADEFDRSFLELDPRLAIVTSLEPEHMECYGDEATLRLAFMEFARRATGRDGVLVCADDPGAVDLGRVLEARTYGFAPEADWRIERVGSGREASKFRMRGEGMELEFALAVPGEHNARNAAAALAAAVRLGADPATLPDALRSFGGVERRLQTLARREGAVVLDDYAHHPTEVRASLQAVRERWPAARLVVVFQPHLYTRTRAEAPGFAGALAAADIAHVLPIYPAREAPIPGVSSALIVGAAPAGVRESKPDEALQAVRAELGRATPGCPVVCVFMGAGDVTELAHRAARELADDALGA